MSTNNLDSLIIKYHAEKNTNTEILLYLSLHHSINISISTLKRRLKRLGLKRRLPVDCENREDVRDAIAEELHGSSSCLGYRKVWDVLKSKGVNARRSTVMEVLREIDPLGSEARKKRRLHRRIYSVPGPNHLWHIDGYDKLKPYGFSIHGCIDGFSRKIIWLEVGTSNKDPRIITKYYLESVRKISAVPVCIRSDDGTENSIIEALQITLRSQHDDEYSGISSFKVGSSPANQRIESLWSQFTKDRPMWWRLFFKELSSLGFVDVDDPVLLNCLRYCFMPLIRSELEDFVERWNQHLLAPSRIAILPRGKPNSLYYLPQLFDSESYEIPIDIEELDDFESPDISCEKEDVSLDFVEFVSNLNLRCSSKPQNAEEGLRLYFNLLEEIEINS